MSFTTTKRSSLWRNILVGTSLSALVLVLGASATSCITLKDIDGSQCGNHVVEPNNGEACDNDDTTRCGAPSTIGACRFLCDYQDPRVIVCDPGFGCGLDGICRKSDGLSDSPISIGGGGTQKLMSGDFDGDGRIDVVAVGISTADVHFLTTEGLIDRTVTLPNERGIPAVGDVNEDNLSDLVLALDHSMGVLLGQEDRSFVPQSYTTTTIEPNTRKLVPLGAYTPDGTILGLRVIDKVTHKVTHLEFLKLEADGGHEHIDVDLKIPGFDGGLPGSVEGAVATVGVEVGGLPCGVIAFARHTPDDNIIPGHVTIATRCDKEVLPSRIDDVPLALGMDYGGKPWGGVFFADVDNDRNPEVVFGVDRLEPDPVGKALYFIKDAGTALQTITPFIDRFSEGKCDIGGLPPSLSSAPLAIADINGDGRADIVDSRGILLQGAASNDFWRACHSYVYAEPKDPMDPMSGTKTEASWTSAVIGDFNGDGVQDVLAARNGVGILDLWTWQAGGFNTIPIFVGGNLVELAVGDLDGDTIADAVVRLAPPPGMPVMKPAPPDPLYVIFGNPLALPSAPRLLGYVSEMQHIAIGRINGENAANQVDPLSDVVVLSASSGGRMPLTLFQGNSTRNLVSPLSLQANTTSTATVESTDTIYGTFVSNFGYAACAEPGEEAQKMANIIALGDTGQIWLAGCKSNGSSVLVQDFLDLNGASFLFAPVDRNESAPPPANATSVKDKIAVFMTNPPVGLPSDPPKMRPLGLGLIEYPGDDNNTFDTLDFPLPKLVDGINLPSKDNIYSPFAFADLDDNGLRDVIVTGKVGNQRKVFIFWNGDSENQSGDLSAGAMSYLDFTPASNPNDDNPARDDMGEITDVVALNYDDDHYKELAILTRDNIYIAKLTLQRSDTTASTDKPLLVKDRPFALILEKKAFAGVRGGAALLAIDADSDGIDDLIVADQGKLSLYVGTERLK